MLNSWMCGWDVTTWKQHRTAQAHQKEVHDISSTEGKHGVHCVLHSHKVPRQQWDTRRVHLSHKKHSQWLRHTRQTLSSRTHSHQLLLTSDCAWYKQGLQRKFLAAVCSLWSRHTFGSSVCLPLAKWTPRQNTTGVWAAQGRSNPTWIHGLQQATAW